MSAGAGAPPRSLLWILAGGRLIGAAGALVAFAFFTLYLRDQFHLALAAVGTIAGLLSAGAVGGTMLGGWASDRIGRRPALLLTLGCEALFLFGLALSRNVLLSAAFGVVLGAADGALWPTFGAAVADILPPRERQQGFAVLAAAVNAGAAVGPAAGGFLLPFGFPRLFLAAAVVEALACAAMAVRLPETHPSHRADAAGRSAPRPAPAGYGVVLRDRTVLSLMAMLLPALMAMGLLITFFPLAAMSTPGVTPQLFGLLFGLWGAVIAVLQLPVTRYARHLRPTVAIAIGYAVMGLAFVPIALLPGPLGFTLGIVGMALSEIFSSPPQGTLIANMAPPGARARYQSMIGLVWSSGGVVGPIVAGLVYGRIDARLFWLVAGAMAVSPSVGFLLWAGRMPRVRQAESLSRALG